MFSKVTTAVLYGLRVKFVQAEADVSNGLPVFHMVGYLSSEVKEASERVRSAIRHTGYLLPAKRIVVNLSPANLRKKGSSFDLPVAIAVLQAMGIRIPIAETGEILWIGELGLDGEIRKVPGILPIVDEAKKQGISICVVPKENEEEAGLVDGICVIGLSHLREVMEENLTGRSPVKKFVLHQRPLYPDFSDIAGQEAVKRAVEVAVAGGHNILFLGPPGAGKTMLAKRIPGILPPLTREESIELTKIYSILGRVSSEQPLIEERPFREVHHTASKPALLGGGQTPLPGEISMAHKGVLFLDELAEFDKAVLEVLRQPLESKEIRLIRTQGTYVYPADFILVGAMNPCPCGCYPDLNRCMCTPAQIQNYLGKISQPFLDRIDICIEVPKVTYESLRGELYTPKERDSARMRRRICAAREIQKQRFLKNAYDVNALLEPGDMSRYCDLGSTEEKLMGQAFQAYGMTARTYHKVLKVARTIADLEGEKKIRSVHLKEAIGYRTLDKKYWGRQGLR